jgi:hypothetical protein
MKSANWFLKSKWVEDENDGYYEITVRRYMMPILFVLLAIDKIKNAHLGAK